jgi:hypothetical protein
MTEGKWRDWMAIMRKRWVWVLSEIVNAISNVPWR